MHMDKLYGCYILNHKIRFKNSCDTQQHFTRYNWGWYEGIDDAQWQKNTQSNFFVFIFRIKIVSFNKSMMFINVIQ